MPARLTIRTSGQTLITAIYRQDGVTPVTVYTSSDLTSTTTVGTITADTTYWVTADDHYVVSVTQLDGTQIADSNGSVDRVYLASGSPVEITPMPTAAQLAADTAGGSTSGLSRTTDVQVFTASGTWTKPSGARFHEVYGVSGGNGGGSGASNAGGAGGGGGGGCSGWNRLLFSASALPSTVSVTVGAGGAGGASVTGAAGLDGSPGGDTKFGSYLLAAARNVDGLQQGQGRGGTTGAGGAGGQGSVGNTAFGTNQSGGAGGGPGASGSLGGASLGWVGGAAAGGGGVTSGASGSGGTAYRPLGAIVDGDPYIVTGEVATNSPALGVGGSPGGAGAAGSTGGSAGQAGQPGGLYGGAGGGGGASLGGASGAGGAGANGCLVVITYF